MPIAARARALTAMLAAIAPIPVVSRNGSTGKIAPSPNKANEKPAAVQASPRRRSSSPPAAGVPPPGRGNTGPSGAAGWAARRNRVHHGGMALLLGGQGGGISLAGILVAIGELRGGDRGKHESRA